MINLLIYSILLEQQCNVSLLKSKFVRPSDTNYIDIYSIDSELYKMQAVVNMSKIKFLQKLIKH